MNVELRVKSLDELQGIPLESYTHIGYGDEGCAKWLPSESTLRELVGFCEKKNKRLTVITPKAPQSVFARVVDTVVAARAMDGDCTVVVNDNGVLYDLAGRVGNLTAGRMINFSTEVCPWHDTVLSEEPEVIRTQSTYLNLREEEKVKLYTKMGITAIETNYLPKITQSSFPFFRDRGWSVDAHFGYANIALTRSCHLTRFDKGVCSSKCRSWYDLSLSQIHQINYSQINQLTGEGDYFEYLPLDSVLASDPSLNRECFNFVLAGTVMLRRETGMSVANGERDGVGKMIFSVAGFERDVLQAHLEQAADSIPAAV